MLTLQDGAVDLTARSVARAGQTRTLTEREAALLAFLARRQGAPVSREELLVQVWGYRPTVYSRAVDHTVKRLRPKIEVDPAHPVHLLTVTGLGYSFRPAPVRRSVRLALPPPPALFVGRDADLEALEAAFREDRLVVLLGPGGVGKTALALQHAHRAPPAIFVDCAAATGGRDVASSVARALDIRGGEAGLGAALRDQGDVLVVLDNLEQALDDECVRLERWLAEAPELRLLVTSRQRPGLAGERVVPVRPLSSESAVTLFDGVAGRASASYDARASAPFTRQLVERLDRLPLSIRLVAARAPALSAREMLDRLDARFRLVATRSPGLPPRQRTLRHVLADSWNLLDADLQGALARLSLARGRVGLDALEVLLEGTAGGAWVVDVAQELVDRSLLEVSGDDGTTRYRLFESVRSFAAERLAEREHRPVRARWHAFLADRADALADRVRAADGRQALAELSALRPDLLAAFRADLEADPHRAGRIALALDRLHERHGPLGMRMELLDAAIEAVDPVDDRLCATLLRVRGVARAMTGDSDRALPDLQAAVTRLERLDVPEELCVALRDVAGALRFSGRSVEAMPLYRRAEAIARGLDWDELLGPVLNNITALHFELGDVPAARVSVEESLAVLRRTDNHQSVGIALLNRAEVEQADGDLEAAWETLEQALAIFADAGDQRRAAFRYRLGAIRAGQGRLVEAEELLREGLGATMRAADARVESMVRLHLGLVLMHRGAHEAAVQCVEAARSGMARHRSSLEAPARAILAVIWSRRGRVDRAERHLQAAVSAAAAGAHFTAPDLVRAARVVLAGGAGDPAFHSPYLVARLAAASSR